jgi:hypothetical protein
VSKKTKKKPNRSGQRIAIDLDTNVYEAVKQAAHEDGNRPFQGMLAKICREWFAGVGQVEAKRQIIPIPLPPRKGRPPKNAPALATSPVPAPVPQTRISN